MEHSVTALSTLLTSAATAANAAAVPIERDLTISAKPTTKQRRAQYDFGNHAIWADDEIPAIDAKAAAMTRDPSLQVSTTTTGGALPTVDSREVPETQLHYTFEVGAEDVYLGLSGKANSMQHADHLVARIALPRVTSAAAEVDVDVTPGSVVELRSRDYFLSMPLPVTVQHDRGSAQWDASKRTLTLKLPIVSMWKS
ncbi:hypothetical protein BC828DRAFT_415554 [Blastocladiella britannica]|nr:hypothetical protein BC828DRAFT_415554 [Blastocladiella britannica]